MLALTLTGSGSALKGLLLGRTYFSHTHVLNHLIKPTQVKDKAQAIVDAIAVDKGLAEEKLEKARPALLEAELALQVRNQGYRV